MEHQNIDFLSPVSINIKRDKDFKLITKKMDDEYLLKQKRVAEQEFYDLLLGKNNSDHQYTI